MDIKRDLYLEKLLGARRNQLVKVITGPRRCGKTYLLTRLFHTRLVEEGVPESQIIEISMEDRRNRKLIDPDAFLDYIDSKTNEHH